MGIMKRPWDWKSAYPTRDTNVHSNILPWGSGPQVQERNIIYNGQDPYKAKLLCEPFWGSGG